VARYAYVTPFATQMIRAPFISFNSRATEDLTIVTAMFVSSLPA